jgi:hypothetical protein
MVKIPDLRAPELPREFLARLDPELAAAYSNLSVVLASPIAILVKEAVYEGVHPNRVLKFAYLYATAERRAQGEADSKDHARRSRRELAGYIQGFKTGYRDEAEAQQRYRRGRRARQHIKASLDPVVTKWRRFVEVVEKHRSELPVHVRPLFSKAKLYEIREMLHKMEVSTVVDEEDLAQEKILRERSVIAQTYIWWYLKMRRYYGKWNDMHRLAFVWRLSPTESVKSFRTVVSRTCKGVTCTDSFGEPWESAFSEKV